MVNGHFIGNTPVFSISIGWGNLMKNPMVILDTGFTGDIQLTPKIATELGLQPITIAKTQMANGQITNMPQAIVLVAMEGEQHYVDVLISNSQPLAGINLLTQFSYKAIVDCRRREVLLEKVVNGE